MDNYIYPFKANKNNILEEGLFFGSNIKMVNYTQTVELFKLAAEKLDLLFQKSVIGRNINVYKHGYPKCYLLGKNDFRIVPAYIATVNFKLSDVVAKTGLTEHIVINEIQKILNDLLDDNILLKGGLYYSDQHQIYVHVRFYLNEGCFKDMLTQKGKVSINKDSLMSEIEENLDKTVSMLKNHPLGKYTLPSNMKNNIYLVNNSKSLIRQISSGSYSSTDFANFGLDSFSVGLNLKYFVEENLLFNTNLAVSQYYLKDNYASLFLGNRNTVNVKSPI